MALRQSIREFEEAMVGAGGAVYALSGMVEPGLDRGSVEGAFARAGVEPPEELVAYWTLSNGLRLRDPAAFPPRTIWDPCSLDAAIANYLFRIEQTDLEYSDPKWIELTTDVKVMASAASDGGCRVRPRWAASWADGVVNEQLESICVIFDVATTAIREGMIVPMVIGGIPSWEPVSTRTEWLALGCGTDAFGW